MKKLFLRILFVLMLGEGVLFCPVDYAWADNPRANQPPAGVMKAPPADYRGNVADNAARNGGNRGGKNGPKKGDYADIAVDWILLIWGGQLIGAAIHIVKEYLGFLVPDLPVWVATNISESIGNLAHMAIAKWMRKAQGIAAQFIGDEGHVTDRWVGDALGSGFPTGEMEDIGNLGSEFSTVAFDANEYKGLKDANPDAMALWKYRKDNLVEDMRDINNVSEENWSMNYNSQRRAIGAMASAMKLKATLNELAQIDDSVSPDYSSLPGCWKAVGNHRALYDQLMLLKLNVIAARTKMRSEMLELDFKPKTRNCSESDVSECDEKGCQDLADAGYKWNAEKNACEGTAATCATDCSKCADQASCTGSAASCLWAGTACMSKNVLGGNGNNNNNNNNNAQCSVENPSACKSEADCTGLGSGYMYIAGQCTKVTVPGAGDSPGGNNDDNNGDNGNNDVAQCSAENLAACTNEADCTGLGSGYIYAAGRCTRLPDVGLDAINLAR